MELLVYTGGGARRLEGRVAVSRALGPKFLVKVVVNSRITDHKGKGRLGRKPRWDKDFWREVRGHEVVPAAVTIVTRVRMWRS